MKKIILFLAAGVFAVTATSASAGEESEMVVEEKIVVELNTDDFTIEETDLSHLAVGDAETIVTESGKTVDLLRTEDGVEVYIDGELVETGGSHDEKHIVHKIKIVCDEDEENCGDLAAVSELVDIDVETLHKGEHKVVVIKGEGEEWDVEMLPEGAHEVHGTVHIVKELDDVELGELHEEHHREVIIIKKKQEDEI